MNIIPNYTDTSKWFLSGWGGSRTYDSVNGYINMQATNGWSSILWDTSSVKGLSITIDFDYYLPTATYQDYIAVGTRDTNSLVNTVTIDQSLKNKWIHKSVVLTASNYTGFSIRNKDSQGITETVYIKNVIISLSSDLNVLITKTGIFNASGFCENSAIKSISSKIIIMNEIIEY